MTRPVILGAGSCIVEAVINQFRSIPDIAEKAELHLSQFAGGGRPRVDAALLARTDIVVEEAAPWQGSGTLTAEERALLPAQCVTVTVPTLHFNVLWPLMTEDPRNLPEPGAPYGRIPFPMGDRLALKLHQTVADPAERRAKYHATKLAEVVNLSRSFELESRAMFAREQGCDVRVAAYVLTNFRERRLFYTHAHPTPELLVFVLAQLFAIPALRDAFATPYEALLAHAASWAERSYVFAGEEAPIHPDVAAHFGLRWWEADGQYAWLRERRSFADWIDFLLTYTPAPAKPEPEITASWSVEQITGPTLGAVVPVGAYVAGMAAEPLQRGWRLLRPREEVRRVPFVLLDGPGLAAAPHGGLLSAPEQGQYAVGPTLLASFPDALVTAPEGLVVADGKLLGDTLRNVRRGDPGSAVAEIEDGQVRFRADPAAAARRVPGRHLLGFSNYWEDMAHWLLTSLPRIAAFRVLHGTEPTLRLLLPAFEPKTLQAQTLALFGIDAAAIEVLAPGETVRVETLLTLGAFDLWSVSPMVAAAAAMLREAALAAVPDSAGEWTTERLFLLPKGGAVVLANLSELVGHAVEHGFYVTTLEGMPLAQQIALLNGARMVAAAQPDALARTVFCRPGTTVIDLCHPAAAHPMIWSTVSVAGLAYACLVGAEQGGGGFAVPLPLFAAALEKLGAAEAVLS